MKIAVTGANGYLGRTIVSALLAQGHDIVALSRRPVPGLKHMLFVLPDSVPTPEALRREGIDVLIHCAWDFRPRMEVESRHINVDGAAKLVRAAECAGMRLIAISSMSVFPGCRSLYGKLKLEMEQIFKAAGGLMLRPGLIWSADAGGMVGTLDKLVKLPVAPVIFARGKLYLVHVEDLAALIIAALAEGWIPGQVLTVGHPEPFRLAAVMRVRARRLGRAPVLLPMPWPLAWAGLRVLEILAPQSSLRSDSVIGLACADPAPHFDRLPVVLRGFA